MDRTPYQSMQYLFSLCLAIGAASEGWAQQTKQETESQLFNIFLNEGVQVVPDVCTVLPPPLLFQVDSASEKLEILERLSSRHGFQRFVRPSVMAPVHIELKQIVDSTGQRVGHHIYSSFIVYASLMKLRDPELLESLLATSSADGEKIGFRPEPLPTEVLASLGIAAPDNERTRYSSIYLPLMNRVALRGTARIERIEASESTILIWQFDPRFTSRDPNDQSEQLDVFQNFYWKIERNNLGTEVEAPPVPYSGCGGYLAVQETGQQQDQLLVESHLVLHEPSEWFAGSNFLRSKFPAALQEGAQSFRRRVAKDQ